MTKIIKVKKINSYSQSQVLALLKICRESDKHLNLNMNFEIKESKEVIVLQQRLNRGTGFHLYWGEVPGKILSQKLIKSFGSIELDVVGSLLVEFQKQSVLLADKAIQFRKKEIEKFSQIRLPVAYM